MLSQCKQNAEGEFAPLYFNSTTKTPIVSEDSLDRSFQEVFKMIDNWIIEGSGWMIESIDGEYVNISIYSPLSGNSYTELPNKLRNSKKGWINIKVDDNQRFLCCHIKHLNPLKTHPERIAKADSQMVDSLDYGYFKFPVSKKNYGRIEKKKSICINVFCFEDGLVCQVHVSDEKFEDCMVYC